MFRFLNRSVQSSNFRLLRPATITIDLFVNNFYNFFGCQVILPRYSTTTSHDDLLNVYRPAHRGCCSSIPNSLLHACVAGWSFIMLNCHSNDRSSPTFKQSTEDGRTAQTFDLYFFVLFQLFGSLQYTQKGMTKSWSPPRLLCNSTVSTHSSTDDVVYNTSRRCDHFAQT